MQMLILLKRAHALADRSVDDLKSSLSSYTTEDDLSVLRIGFVICHRRRDADRCKLLATRIEKLREEISHE
jgi:hypothetical protein